MGWLLAIPLIAVLALIGEQMHIGGAQSLVGAGVGVAVGFMQARSLRGTLTKVAPWFWASAIGLTVPFLPSDIAKGLHREIPYSLTVCIAVGGVITGTWQSLILAKRFDHSRWWILSSTIGWSLAASTSPLAERLSHLVVGLVGALIYLGGIAAGGLVLGAVTNASFKFMHLREAPRTQAGLPAP